MHDPHLVVSAGVQVFNSPKSVKGRRRLAEDPPSGVFVWDELLKPRKCLRIGWRRRGRLRGAATPSPGAAVSARVPPASWPQLHGPSHLRPHTECSRAAANAVSLQMLFLVIGRQCKSRYGKRIWDADNSTRSDSLAVTPFGSPASLRGLRSFRAMQIPCERNPESFAVPCAQLSSFRHCQNRHFSRLPRCGRAPSYACGRLEPYGLHDILRAA